jgi:hypothetical protein
LNRARQVFRILFVPVVDEFGGVHGKSC